MSAILGAIIMIIYCCRFFFAFFSQQKVVYFTATFPYVLITIMLIRAVALENASEGLVYYLKPNLTRLQDGQVRNSGGWEILKLRSLTYLKVRRQGFSPQ